MGAVALAWRNSEKHVGQCRKRKISWKVSHLVDRSPFAKTPLDDHAASLMVRNGRPHADPRRGMTAVHK